MILRYMWSSIVAKHFCRFSRIQVGGLEHYSIDGTNIMKLLLLTLLLGVPIVEAGEQWVKDAAEGAPLHITGEASYLKWEGSKFVEKSQALTALCAWYLKINRAVLNPHV